MTGERWRVGRKVGRTIYAHEQGADDGVLIGMMDTPELAAEVVRAVNWRLIGEPRGADSATECPSLTRLDLVDESTWPVDDQCVEVRTAGEWRDAIFRISGISPADPYWSTSERERAVIYAAETGDLWLPFPPPEGDQ